MHAARLRRRHPVLAFHGDLSTGGDLLDRRTLEQLVGVGEFRVTFDGEDLRSSRSGSHESSAARLERVRSNLGDLRTVRRPLTVCARLPSQDHGEPSPHVERYHRVLRGDGRFDLTLCTPPEILVEQPTPTSFVVRPEGRVDRCSPPSAPIPRMLERRHRRDRVRALGVPRAPRCVDTTPTSPPAHLPRRPRARRRVARSRRAQGAIRHPGHTALSLHVQTALGRC